MRDGWRETTLGEIAHIQQGSRVAHQPPGKLPIPVLGATGIVGSWTESSWSDPRVALGCRGTVGGVRLVDEPSWFGNNVMALWPKDAALISVEFLALMIEGTDLNAQGAIGGQVQKQITRKSLSPVRFPLPPLDEQRRIVDLIGAVDDAIEASEIAKVNLEALGDARRRAVFDRGGESVALEEVASFASGAAFPPAEQGDKEGTIPFIKVSDMNHEGNEHYIFASTNHVTDEALKRLKAKTFPVGTTVFPKVGAALLTEKRRMLTQETAFDNNVMGVVPREGINPLVVNGFMRTVRLGDYAQAGALPSVNQGHLRRLRVPLGAIQDQDRLAEELSSLDAVVAESLALRRTQRVLRSNLLTALLSGEHEIPKSYDELFSLEEAA